MLCQTGFLHFLCRNEIGFHMPTKHLVIKGKVQGVFYRASAKEVAEKLHLTGWVKNTEDGDVEATITGLEEKLNVFIDWCKHGPPAAIVTAVEVSSVEEKSFENFAVLRG